MGRKPSPPSASKSLTASAARVLEDGNASKGEKQLAASMLSNASRANKDTARRAAKAIRDPNASKDVKAVAASALVQRPKFKADDIETRKIYEAVRKYYSQQSASRGTSK